MDSFIVAALVWLVVKMRIKFFMVDLFGLPFLGHSFSILQTIFCTECPEILKIRQEFDGATAIHNQYFNGCIQRRKAQSLDGCFRDD
jgi:hypothetical protein